MTQFAKSLAIFVCFSILFLGCDQKSTVSGPDAPLPDLGDNVTVTAGSSTSITLLKINGPSLIENGTSYTWDANVDISTNSSDVDIEYRWFKSPIEQFGFTDTGVTSSSYTTQFRNRLNVVRPAEVKVEVTINNGVDQASETKFLDVSGQECSPQVTFC